MPAPITNALAEVATLQANIQLIRSDITNLENYLQSSKFWTDPTVQVSDVLLRLREITNKISDRECYPDEYAGLACLLGDSSRSLVFETDPFGENWSMHCTDCGEKLRRAYTIMHGKCWRHMPVDEEA